METALFDYPLPTSFIAQQPAEPRDSSRLLVLRRNSGPNVPSQIDHRIFREIGDYLRPGDLLVANNSRVIPARLMARKESGGAVEVFLLRQQEESGQEWECLVRGKKLVTGVVLEIGRRSAGSSTETPPALSATILAVNASGTRLIRFAQPIRPYLDQLGDVPLPPYITQYSGDRERYQTIYSQPEGSAAAPTAGLHFTPTLLEELNGKGVGFATVTLHVGLDTFKPVEEERIEAHVIHSEWAELSTTVAEQINQTRRNSGRVIAVGTTSVRTLEWAAQLTADRAEQGVVPFAGNVNLFIRPGYRFRVVDGLITNFHLPRSTLLLLVSAFVGQLYLDQPTIDKDIGRQRLLAAYEVAKAENYRFFSFGDAMLIL